MSLERATIAERQGASEDQKFIAKLLQSNRTLFFTNGIYRNNLKNREYAKEARRFLSNVNGIEAAKLKKLSDANKTKSGVCPTQAKTDSSGCFGIIHKNNETPLSG